MRGIWIAAQDGVYKFLLLGSRPNNSTLILRIHNEHLLRLQAQQIAHAEIAWLSFHRAILAHRRTRNAVHRALRGGSSLKVGLRGCPVSRRRSRLILGGSGNIERDDGEPDAAVARVAPRGQQPSRSGRCAPWRVPSGLSAGRCPTLFSPGRRSTRRARITRRTPTHATPGDVLPFGESPC